MAKTNSSMNPRLTLLIFPLVIVLSFLFLVPMSGHCEVLSGEQCYNEMRSVCSTDKGVAHFKLLNQASESLAWESAAREEFEGNVRMLQAVGKETVPLYLIRKLSGELYILSMDSDPAYYENLDELMENKLRFSLSTLTQNVAGQDYYFARFEARPEQPAFDRIFKISIILMLFFVMFGMGLTLTLKDFSLVFSKPKAVLIGVVLQFGVMPFLAYLIGNLAGYYEAFPYIYVGFILIAVSPGGVTSNLMTHFAKGDLALSISLTSFSTVLSLFFTPFLLALYCTNVPEVTIPVGLVMSTIVVLVIIPLLLGMLVRGKWLNFAEKATPFFSILGILTVLFIMVAGVLSNLDKFSDTSRYNAAFYFMVFLLTLLGMIVGGVLPKLLKVNNYQTRAVSLETGLRNSALAMTIAILIQDQMGDFYSSMFVVSGIFGLEMYLAGLAAILVFRKLLPINNENEEEEIPTEEMIHEKA